MDENDFEISDKLKAEYEELARTNFKKFLQLAEYFYGKDKKFYDSVFQPILDKVEKNKKINEEGNEEIPNKIYCVHCGAENTIDSIHCKSCGKKLIKKETNTSHTRKHTQHELELLAATNFDYFYEIAEDYRYNDAEFYDLVCYPIIERFNDIETTDDRLRVDLQDSYTEKLSKSIYEGAKVFMIVKLISIIISILVLIFICSISGTH